MNPAQMPEPEIVTLRQREAELRAELGQLRARLSAAEAGNAPREGQHAVAATAPPPGVLPTDDDAARSLYEASAAAMRDAQGLNALMLNSSRDCIVLLDLEGRTQYVSPGGVESMQIADVASILNLSWLRVWKGDDLAAAVAAVDAARAGGIGRFQGFCPTHTGVAKWWDVVISRLGGPAGTPGRLVSVGRDITALKLAEQQLAISEERHRTVTQMLPQLVWTCLPDGRCDSLGRQWVDYTGMDEDVQLGLDWLDRVIHPDDRDRTYAHWMGAVAGHHPYDIDYRIRRRDGAYRWFKTRGTPIRDADGKISYWFGTCTDIQDVYEAREVLTRSRAELERIVEARTRERDRAWKNSLDLQAIIDAEGRVRSANDAWTHILGWHPDDVVHADFFHFVHPEDHAAGRQALASALQLDLQKHENRCRHKNGDYRWFSWVAAPEDGLIYASGRHVTAEKEAAAQLDAANEKLRQSQKMEALGQLTGGVAHDFNNLLGIIIGNTEILKRRVAGRLDDVVRYIESSQGAARRAAALTHRLLAFARRQPLDPKRADVNRLVAAMEELVRRTVGPSIWVEVVGAAGVWPTLVDSNQLENALLNLCINARDAMPDGGRLTIETANRWMDERAARERELPSGQYVSLSVTDTGTGMAPEVVKRAFDPFFTTKPMGMGTGLGLSMVYGFARQSGGQVRIYSEVGRGTTMCLYLPRHHGAVEEAEAPPGAGVEIAAEGETLLLVDDELDLRLLVAEVLGESGYTVLQAGDGSAALKVLEAKRRVDLLVTDVGLPGGINGRQLADAARVMRPGLEVLFITGYAENAVVGNGLLEPGMNLMTKPFGMDDLVRRIQEITRH